jgi:hypothetical protein
MEVASYPWRQKACSALARASSTINCFSQGIKRSERASLTTTRYGFCTVRSTQFPLGSRPKSVVARSHNPSYDAAMRSVRCWQLAASFSFLSFFTAGHVLAGPDETYYSRYQRPCGKEHCCFCRRVCQAFDVTWPYEFCDDFDYPRPCYPKHHNNRLTTSYYSDP